MLRCIEGYSASNLPWLTDSHVAAPWRCVRRIVLSGASQLMMARDHLIVAERQSPGMATGLRLEARSSHPTGSIASL
jgi:hypothetical protein